jgi:hypothetical protein
MGGKMSGLAIAITFGLVGGMGGKISGLAIADIANAAIAKTKIKPRILIDLNVMVVHPLLVKTTAHTKSNPKGASALPQK